MEGPLPGEQLVEDDAEAEDVGTPVDPMPLAARLFGTHVRRRARRSVGPVPKFDSRRARPKSAT